MVKPKKEQIDVIGHEDGNLLVSASAGSGKTYVMIERLIRLISQRKADVSQILAVTFTESAASDMKEKLKSALIKEVVKTGDEYLLEEYKKVATADISTLHSFCSRLIRLYFYMVGVSHDFTVADEVVAQKLRIEAINKTFRFFYKENDLTFKKIALRHSSKRSDKKFKEQILDLYSFFSTEAHPEILKEMFLEMYSKEGYERFLSEFICLFKEELLSVKDKLDDVTITAQTLNKEKLFQLCKDIQSDYALYLSANTIDELRRLKTYVRPIGTEKKLEGLSLQVKEEVVSYRNRLSDAAQKFLSCLYDDDTMENNRLVLLEHAQCLVKIIDKFTEFYAELKKEENVLDFDDLQHYALQTLSNEAVRKAVREKYKYIFVDEYQDVNGVQEELINVISTNNVFMVGDVKQSIYGFRGCRPDFFLKKYEKMSKVKGQTALLNYSFRSSQKVIEMVNDVFNFCMDEKNFGLDYKKTSQLTPGGIYPDDKLGRAELHFLQKKGKGNKVVETPRLYNVLDEIKETESECASISSLITKIINDELGKTFYDPKAEKERFVTYKDIAILTRKRENAYVMDLINGLKKHNIPVTSSAKEDIRDYPEIQVMINVLKLIDCMVANIPLATVLKSPIGGFSDEDFVDICAFYIKDSKKRLLDFYDAYEYYLENGNGPLREKLSAFDSYFNEIRELSDFTSIKDVLSKIVNDKNFEAHLFASIDGENKVRRLRAFMDFCASKDYTVKELLSIILDNEDGVNFLSTEESDAVRVMTTHASKGLEFPVVIVCGLEKKFGVNHESDEFLTDNNDGVAFRLYGDDRVVKSNIWRVVFQKRQRKSLVMEEMRILYVALTRASYSLHMTIEGDKDPRKTSFDGALCFADCIPLSTKATLTNAEDLFFEELKRGTRKVIIGNTDEKTLDRLKDNFNYEYPYLADTTLPLKSSVTALLLGDEERAPLVIFDDTKDFSVTDKERGVIAHKFMELADFNALNKDLEPERMVDNNLISKQDLDKIDVDKLVQVLKSDTFTLPNSAKAYREKSFIIDIPAKEVLDVKTESNILLQGVIDLLIVDGNTAKIVDYKYSKLSAERLKEKYALQLNLYAKAVEKVLGVKVSDKIIVSLLSGQIVKID